MEAVLNAERPGSQLLKQGGCGCRCDVPGDLSDPMTLKLNLPRYGLHKEDLTRNSNLWIIVKRIYLNIIATQFIDGVIYRLKAFIIIIL